MGDEQGGVWKTPGHLTTIDQTQKAMDQHLDIHKATTGVVTSGGGGAKPAQAVRPEMEQDMTDQDWAVFENGWERYKRVTNLTTDTRKTDELWECLSRKLKVMATGDGLQALKTEAELLPRLKKLAVKSTNTLVARVKFLQAGQDRNEPVNAFMARLRGLSDPCRFEVKCSHCNQDTSYGDQMIANQLVRALVDEGMQERILTLAAEKGETQMDLKEIVKQVEALETSKRSQGLMAGGAGSLNRLGGRDPNHGGGGAPGGAQGGAECPTCGYEVSNHKGKPCRALELTCFVCNEKGHAARGRVCKGKTQGGSAHHGPPKPGAKKRGSPPGSHKRSMCDNWGPGVVSSLAARDKDPRP